MLEKMFYYFYILRFLDSRSNILIYTIPSTLPLSNFRWFDERGWDLEKDFER